jgi:tight adherence protein C
MLLLFALLGGVVLLVVLSAIVLLREARRRDLESRALALAGGGAAWRGRAGGAGYGGLAALLRLLGERVRRGTRFYSPKDVEQLQTVISAAGLNPRQVLPILLGAKLVLMLLVPLFAGIAASAAGLSPWARLSATGIGLVIGMMGPDWIVGVLRRSYVAALERGTADALDLLVVCSEAGMGLESALERVSQEMHQANRPMGIVLSGLLDDLRVLPDRREAFAKFGKRCGVEGLQRLATMLAQTLQYGTPLSQALRAVAAELRREQANRLEERAAKLPAKLVFPMIVFIMPCLYVMLLGSSFLRLYDALGSFISHLPATASLPITHH